MKQWNLNCASFFGYTFFFGGLPISPPNCVKLASWLTDLDFFLPSMVVALLGWIAFCLELIDAVELKYHCICLWTCLEWEYRPLFVEDTIFCYSIPFIRLGAELSSIIWIWLHWNQGMTMKCHKYHS